jgi:SM-20-related protein
MVRAEFLSKFGLLVIRNFLDSNTCEQYRNAALRLQSKRATIAEGGAEYFDPGTRQTNQIELDPQFENELHTRLLSVQPKLEDHFHEQLSGCTRPVFLTYGVGDYFKLHRDTLEDKNLPESIQRRKVSVSVLLNNCDEQDKPLTYSGGALTFYSLINDPRLKSRGFPLQGEEGVLIAFPSRTLHEVQPVTRGERYSIVSWFY